MVFERSALFSSISLILVVCVVETLISPSWVLAYLARLAKVWPMLYPLLNFVHKFLKCHIESFSSYFKALFPGFSLGPLLKASKKGVFMVL